MKTAMAALALLLARADAQESQNFRDPSPHQVRFIELGDGQPLILLAGSRNSGHVFDGFAEQLSGIAGVYGIAGRGYGASSLALGGYDAQRRGEDVLRVMEGLDLRAPLLAGHSLGGTERTALASAHPDRFSGLIYMDSDPTFDWSLYDVLRRELPASMTRAHPAWQNRTSGIAVPESEFRNVNVTLKDGSTGPHMTPSRAGEAITAGLGKPDYSRIHGVVLAFYRLPEPLDAQVRRYQPKTDEERRAMEQVYDFEVQYAPSISSSMRTSVRDARMVELPGANHYLFLSHTAQVKSNSPAFEAASVKPSRRRLGRDAGSRVEMGAGAVTARNVTLKQLISSAYRVQPELIVGGPRWLDESEYDIEAKASGPSSAEAIRGMLRALLVERFGLKAHRESRQMRVYALVQDKGGAKIRPLENDAAPGAADFRGDLRQFASFISLRLTIPPAFDPAQPSIAGGPQVPVLDETGMEGVFEFNLDLKPELGADSFTLWQRALREQLGLRLESRMEQVETLVVDRAAKIPQAD